ncbi:hypothetical protein FHU33_3327 [Blastococcus colisei]|uniref:Uncharacterized protein n=1 Tax=Blastococcus colisei TaxID=1564162 RepID=A0A543PIH8_9ACTN|nr:hypothetical protein FHU33_3327 [Blastococcus colisei]
MRVLAGLGLVTYSLLFAFVAAETSGIVTSSPVGSPDDPLPSPEALAGAAAPGEAVHLVGALGVLALGASGLIALLLGPHRLGASRQVLAAVLAFLVAVPIVGNPDNVGGQAGAVDPVLLVLGVPPLLAALVAGPFRAVGSDPLRPLPLILAAVAIPIAASWGVGQALNQRNTFPPTADPHHQAHWQAMAVFAFAVVLVLAAAAFAGSGWRLGATMAGMCAMAFGVTTIVAPTAASAAEPIWAVAALVWGVAVLYAAWSDKPRADGRR